MTTQAVRDKGAEQSKHELLTRRIVSYLVLAILCFLCLFFFYVLIIIQRGFSFLPGKSFTTNLKNVLADANIPILSGIKNSLLVAALSAVLSIYFSALTAYGVHAYDFKLKKIASAFIILIMTMPTQVSADGVLLHDFLHEEQPADGNCGGRAHRWLRRIPHLQLRRSADHETGARRAGDFHLRRLVE